MSLLIAVSGLAQPALAFTEPSTAPPGGAAAAPLNVSPTAQTKQGRLNVGMLAPANALDTIGLAIGSAGTPKFLCLNGENIADANLCIDSWTDIVGSGAVLTNPGPTPAYAARIQPADYDPGFVAIGARDYTQVWAIGGQAANLTGAPPRSTTVGVYGSSAEGFVAEPYDANARSYGVLGVAHTYVQLGPPPAPGGVVRTAGIVGYSANENPASFFENSGTGPAAVFKGSVGGGYTDPANVKSGFTFTRGLNPEPTSNIEDAISAYTDMLGSGIYIEQRNFLSSTAYAGYFSGRVAAIGIVDPDNPTDGQDSVLKVQCQADGTNCLDVDVEREADFTWQTLRHTGDEKWRIGSNQTAGRGQFYFGLDARSSAAPIGAGNIFKILQTGEAAFGSIANVNPEPQLLVRRGVADANDGNPNNAVDIIANVSDTALYVEQQNPDPAAWAASFSGNVEVGSAADPKNFCLNDVCMTSISGGPGGSHWKLSGGNIVSPLATTTKVAIGGSSSAAPFFFDPEANILSVTGETSGNLALKNGALTLKAVPIRPEDPPEGGLFQPRETETLLERVASALTPAAALAGSVTNPGGAPPVRLLVSGGVISVESGTNKLELGNAGRDIASNSDIYLRPNAVAGGPYAARFTTVNGRTRLELPYLSLAADDIAAQPLNISHSAAATSFLISNTAVGLVTPTAVVSNKATGANAHGVLVNLSGAGNSSSAVYAMNASASGWAGFFAGRVNIDSPYALCFDEADCRTSWPTLGDLGGINGSGSVNVLPKWTALTTLGNSQITDNGTTVQVGTPTSIGGHTLIAYNDDGANPYNAMSAFKSAGIPMRGSALYGEVVSGTTCAAGQACAAVYGSALNTTGVWAGYFTNGVLVEGGINPFQVRSNYEPASAFTGTIKGHTSILGGASDSSGVASLFMEGENLNEGTTLVPGCPMQDGGGNYHTPDAGASGGYFVLFRNCSAPFNVNNTSSVMNIPLGNYRAMFRLKKSLGLTSTTITLQAGAATVNLAHSELTTSWQLYSLPFVSSGGDVTLSLKSNSAFTGDVSLDSIYIVPDETPNDVMSAVLGTGDSCTSICGRYAKSCVIRVNVAGNALAACTTVTVATDYCLCGR